MGYTRHDAVIVTLDESVLHRNTSAVVSDVNVFRAALPPRWQPLVVGPVPGVVNDIWSYVFLPDGSKENWEDSADGDRYREQFAAVFANLLRPNDYDLVHIRYGGDEPGQRIQPELTVSSHRGTTVSSAISDEPRED